jgi:cell division protein FtsN
MTAAPDTLDAAAAPPQDQSPPAVGDGDSGPLAVQVASFQTRRRAEEVRDAVSRTTGLPAAVLPAEVDGAVWYRILMGAFDSEDAARAAAEPLLRARTIRVVVVREIPGGWVPFLSGTGPAPPD